MSDFHSFQAPVGQDALESTANQAGFTDLATAPLPVPPLDAIDDPQALQSYQSLENFHQDAPAGDSMDTDTIQYKQEAGAQLEDSKPLLERKSSRVADSNKRKAIREKVIASLEAASAPAASKLEQKPETLGKRTPKKSRRLEEAERDDEEEDERPKKRARTEKSTPKRVAQDPDGGEFEDAMDIDTPPPKRIPRKKAVKEEPKPVRHSSRTPKPSKKRFRDEDDDDEEDDDDGYSYERPEPKKARATEGVSQSGRRVAKVNYRELEEPVFSEEEDDQVSESDGDGEDNGERQVRPRHTAMPTALQSTTYPVFPAEKIMEKILCHRDKNKAALHKSHFQPTEAAALSSSQKLSSAPELEFLLKWKDMAYIHCEWVSDETIKSFHNGASRLERYWKSGAIEDPEEPYSPSFIEVDRILAEAVVDGETFYFVKWQGLQYDESTWEAAKDINDDYQIQRFRQRNEVPSKASLVIPPRPAPTKFVPMKDNEFKNGNTLRPYQLEGINWLVFGWYNRTNTILADEMGLGKTVQSVMLLNHLFTKEKTRGPFLVVVPLSTIHHWQREIEAWTDMNVVIFHGTQQSRDLIRKVEWTYGNEDKGTLKWHVLLTTYETVNQERGLFESINWQYLVIDEAHRLKNKASRMTQALERMTFAHITLLTGTPIQNNMQELYTLLHILDPERFTSWEDFGNKFGDLKEAAQVRELQVILKKYLLRRMKEDVEKSLAPKEETIIEVELTSLQKKFYRAILERNFDNLVRGGKANNLPSLMNVMMQLRKCCNHPYLLEGVEELELAGVAPLPEVVHAKLIAASGKLVLIDKLLPRLRSEGHKVLIFSQMIHVLDLLEDYLAYRGYKHERIDGRVRGNDRQRAIDRFCSKDSDSFVFLLCTRAGGVGINLTAADTVIIFDSDWNPQNDLQAQARCHRIGQDKKVKIYRLITRNTYEREMFDRASMKLGLDRAVLTHINDAANKGDSGRGNEESRKLTSKEVDQLLKKGVYSLLKEDDGRAEAFSELNIDQILSERTQTIVHKNDNEGPSSTFAQVSFNVTSDTSQPDVNDPDFWKKMLPEQAAKPTTEVDLVVEPRARKQTKRFVFDEEGREGEEYEGSDMSDESSISVVLPPPSKEAVQEMAEFAVEKLSSDSESEVADLELAAENFGRGRGHSRWGSRTKSQFMRFLILFGYGRWDMIRKHGEIEMSDKDMENYAVAFLKKLCAYMEADYDEFMAGLKAFQKVDAPEQKPDEDAMDVDEPAVNPWDNDPSLTTAAFKVTLKKMGTINFKRLKVLGYLNKMMAEGMPDPLPSFRLPKDFPPEWSAKEDRDLIRGIYKHGFGNFSAIVVDPEFCFHDRYVVKEKKSAVTPAGKLVLPSFKLLTAQTKRLIQCVADPTYKPQISGVEKEPKEPKEAKAKDKVKDEAASGDGQTPKKETEKKKVTMTRSSDSRENWFKKEFAVFYKIVTAYGLPLRKEKRGGEEEFVYDFEWIKAEGNLRNRTIAHLKQKYAELVNMSRKVIAYHARGILEEKKSELSLTLIQSKRLLDRIALFAQIRRQVLPLSNEVIDQHLAAAVSSKANLQRWKPQLPEWWTEPHFDRSLLRGVIKHGFANWELILSDPEFTFLPILTPRLIARNIPVPQHILNEHKKINKMEEEVEMDEEEEDNDEGEQVPEEEEEEDEEGNAKPKAKSTSSSQFVKQTPYADAMELPRDQVIYRRLAFAAKVVMDAVAAANKTPVKKGRAAKEAEQQVGEIADFVDAASEAASSTTVDSTMPPPKKKTVKGIDVNRDAEGNIIFPVVVDRNTRVTAFGHIKLRAGFNSPTYIVPVGYKSERDFTSTIDPSKKVVYYNEIIDGGDHPLFRVTPSDDPERPVEASSASSAWKVILDRVQERKKEGSKKTSISGPEFFGFSHPSVLELLQVLPGAEELAVVNKAMSEKRKEGDNALENYFPRTTSVSNQERLFKSLGKDKPGDNLSEVATDEGDDEDFEMEMSRFVSEPGERRRRGGAESENDNDDGEGEVDDEPLEERQQTFEPFQAPAESAWDEPHLPEVNPTSSLMAWDDTAEPDAESFPSLDLGYSASSAPPPPRQWVNPALEVPAAPNPSMTPQQQALRMWAPQHKAKLENDAYNIRAALLQTEPGTMQEAELQTQLEQLQDKIAQLQRLISGFGA